MKVEEYMGREVELVEEDSPLRTVVEMIRMKKIRNVPVLDENGALVGIVTDRDIRRVLPSPFSPTASDDFNDLIDTTPVGRVMTREPLTVGPEDPVSDAVKLILESKIGSLPVVRDGKIVGIFSYTDALRALLEILSDERKDAAVP